MVYDCIKQSDNYYLDYIEIGPQIRNIPLGYDFYFFNYHPVTMDWLDTTHLRTLLKNVGTIVLEVSPGDPFVLCPENDFDFYIVLDPSYRSKRRNVFPFPRPLDRIVPSQVFSNKEIPVIGSFGFATKGKGFQHVVDAVNKEFDRAKVRINIPFGDFIPDSEKYAHFLSSVCKQRAKPGIEVEVTHNFMTKQELVDWCVNNTLNCFLYDRDMPGLSATTDQAILSKRPLAVSQNDTFRHITQYLKPYPLMTLKESINLSSSIVQRIYDEWQPQNFQNKFTQVLHQLEFTSNTSIDNGYIELPIATHKRTAFKVKYRKAIKRITNRIKNGYYLRRIKGDELI